METKIRVLIADPNEDLRLLLSDVLGQEEDMEVAGCAMDGMEALSLITGAGPGRGAAGACDAQAGRAGGPAKAARYGAHGRRCWC